MCTRVVLLIVTLSVTPLFASSSATTDPVLTVRVHLQCDSSITSGTIEKLAAEEAAAIWSVYGVELQWTTRDGRRPAMALDAIVERENADPDAPLVLGHTRITPAPAAQGPIHVSFDAVSRLLRRERGAGSLPQEREIAIALGRVLAHELGHVLLGLPAYHDPAGLMRTTFRAADLIWGRPSSFRLTERSIDRLRVRIAAITSLAGPESPDTSAASSWLSLDAPQPQIR
jgi:hypothetical protein